MCAYSADQPRRGLGGRQILGLKDRSAHSTAPLPGEELSSFYSDDLDLERLDCAIQNAVLQWQSARARNGVDDTGDRIGKGEAGRRLHRALNRLAAGGDQ